MTTTDTPLDACPYCGAGRPPKDSISDYPYTWVCGTSLHPDNSTSRSELCEIKETYASIVQQPHFDEREGHCYCVAALRAEVERLTGRRKEAEDRIKGLHDGWKKARKAHIETCKNAQAEIDKLHTENVCLQELIQEFYEWSRRDFPTEQEVREIMNRYHNLLNK